jgi:serine/threonine protein kinase
MDPEYSYDKQQSDNLFNKMGAVNMPLFPNNNNSGSSSDEMVDSRLLLDLPTPPPCPYFYDFNQTQYGKILGHGATGHVCEGSVITYNNGRQLKPTKFAIKILKSTNSCEKAFYRECHALEILKDVKSVVNLHTSKENVIINNKSTNIMFLEYYQRGEFFDVLEKFPDGLPEQLARYYAKKLWSTIAECHKNGVQHRDIKPENILVADDWSIRLADFGSALTGYQTSAQDYCGTEQYIAPEVSKGMPYSPSAADVWSTAITVFIVLYGIPPFFEASNKCWYFRCVRDKNWKRFWKQQEKARPNAPVLSDEAKAFLQRALDPNPHTRPTADEMMQDDWLTSDDSDAIDIDLFIAENTQ